MPIYTKGAQKSQIKEISQMYSIPPASQKDRLTKSNVSACAVKAGAINEALQNGLRTATARGHLR